MSVSRFVPAPVWYLYRRARWWNYGSKKRNPLAGRVQPLESRQEWDSVRGLLKALAAPPRVIEKDADGSLRWQTAMGPFWTPPGSGADYVGRLAAEMLSGVYDLKELIRDSPHPVVLDCGANVGFFTRFALNSGAARVIAFEPSPGNAACLRRNMEPEIAAGKVTVVPKGVWDTETTLHFATGNKNNPGSHHLTEDGSGDIQVPVTSIDQTCAQLGITEVDYIKVDVEGAEVRAIAGAASTIHNLKPALCIATEHTDDLFANASAVLDAMNRVQPDYRCTCTEAHMFESPSLGNVLTPYSLLFSRS